MKTDFQQPEYSLPEKEPAIAVSGGYRKPLFPDYVPLNGFFDLRNWELSKIEFKKLWGIQKYLHQCEKDRRSGKYKFDKLGLDKVKNLSAEYQQILFAYRNVGGFL